MMYRARVDAVEGLSVRAGGKWLVCIGNAPVRVGDRVWTDGRCVYGNHHVPQHSFVPVQSKVESIIPLLIRHGSDLKTCCYSISIFDEKQEKVVHLTRNAVESPREWTMINSRGNFEIIKNDWRDYSKPVGYVGNPWPGRSDPIGYTLSDIYSSQFEAVENLDVETDPNGNIYMLKWVVKSLTWLGFESSETYDPYVFVPYAVSPVYGTGNITCGDENVGSYKNNIPPQSNSISSLKTVDGWVHSDGRFYVFVFCYDSGQSGFLVLNGTILHSSLTLYLISSDSNTQLWSCNDSSETQPPAHSIKIPMNNSWYFTFEFEKNSVNNLDALVSDWKAAGGFSYCPKFEMKSIRIFNSNDKLQIDLSASDASLLLIYRKINILPLSRQRYLVLNAGNLFLYKGKSLQKLIYNDRFTGTKCVNHRLRLFNYPARWRQEARKYSS